MSLAWVSGVRGRALSHPRPLVRSGVRPGPTTHWLWVRGVRAWEPVTNPTARALARCGGGMRVPGEGAFCLGVGRLGTGALPHPTSRPLGPAAGAHYPLAVGAGDAGVGTRLQPHSARSCVLWGRHEGARGGRLLPGCRASGVRRSPTPDHPSFRACGRGPLPTGRGCGVRAWGPGCPWHLFPCRGSSCFVRASRVGGTRWPLWLGTCPGAVVQAGGVPPWRASWPRAGAPLLVRSGRSRCSGRLSRRRGAFPHPGGCRPRLYWVAARGTWRPAENRSHCACRWPLPRQGRWARSASYPFGAPRWGCPWRVPPALVSGGVCCAGLACVDPVTDASGFPYCPSYDGGLGRCTGAVSCGHRHRPFRVGGRHARVPRVCACACPAWPGRAGRPPGRVLVRLTFPLAVLGFALCLFGPRCGCPVCGCSWFLFFFSLYPSPPSLLPRCVLLCVLSGPGCLRPWPLVAPPPFFLPPPCCLWHFLPSCSLGPLRPPLFFLFFSFFFSFVSCFSFFRFFLSFFCASCSVRGGFVCLGPSDEPACASVVLVRGGIGTPRGVVRYFFFPHTAAVTPESLQSSLGHGGIGTPRGFARYFSFPHTAAVTPESLRSSLGRGGIGTPRGFARYFSFPHTAAVTPESLRSSLGRGGIGTPRGFVRYFSLTHTAAVTPESLRSSLGRGGIGSPRGFARHFSFPLTAAVTPESLRSSLGRGGIGTPRGFARYYSFPDTWLSDHRGPRR